MLISVHLPKTAGTSFSAALEQQFGARLLRDYSDYPINAEPYERLKAALRAALDNGESDFAGIDCIHGHFLPIKYLLLAARRQVTFVTWMRHPVDRVLSHYFFWRRSYDPSAAPALHRRVIEEDWSVERFCLGSEVRDLYWQFLRGFPFEYFDFVGITEFYAEDFDFFARRYLDATIEQSRLNVGDNAEGRYAIDQSLRARIEAAHVNDMRLYQRALENRRAMRSA